MKIKIVQACSNLGACITVWDYGSNDYIKMFNDTDGKGMERALRFCKDNGYEVVK